MMPAYGAMSCIGASFAPQPTTGSLPLFQAAPRWLWKPRTNFPRRFQMRPRSVGPAAQRLQVLRSHRTALPHSRKPSNCFRLEVRVLFPSTEMTFYFRILLIIIYTIVPRIDFHSEVSFQFSYPSFPSFSHLTCLLPRNPNHRQKPSLLVMNPKIFRP